MALWETAIALAQGEYVMILHDDIFFVPKYIFAVDWRQLRRGRWQRFQPVMGLFELPELKSLSCPVKWWVLKEVFFVLGKRLKG